MWKWSAIGDQISKDIDEQIDILCQEGFKYIELRKINKQFLYEYDFNYIIQLREKIQHYGISCSCISTDIGKRTNVRYELAIKLIDYAKQLNVHYIRVFGYFFSENKKLARYAVDYAQNANVTILVENEFNTNARQPSDILRIIAEFNHVELLFDAGNAYRCGVGYKEFLEKTGWFISYIHLKDIILNKEKQVGTYIGKGELNVLNMLDDLFSNGYSGFISLEPHMYLEDNPILRKKYFRDYLNSLKNKVENENDHQILWTYR